jgi:hypothetical protein
MMPGGRGKPGCAVIAFLRSAVVSHVAAYVSNGTEILVPAIRSRLDRQGDETPARRMVFAPPLRSLLLGGIGCFLLPGLCLAASPSRADLEKLQAQILRQEIKLKKQQAMLYDESVQLSSQSAMLDSELRKFRATGNGPGSGAAPPAEPESAASPSSSPAPVTSSDTSDAEAAPISGASPQKRASQRILLTEPTLASTGGVLTPRGQLILDPSLEYDYSSENQLDLSGFTILPGITFGNIFIARVKQNILTGSVAVRLGVTNRLEVNAKLPYVYGYGTTITQPVGPNAQVLSPSAHSFGLGDAQLGASYQINSGDAGWPIFVGNFVLKSTTGVSPFSVPVYTVNDTNGQYLQGISKKLPTGTGFYSAEPSLTILYPTAPGVLFANLLYIKNIAATVDLPNLGGGPPTATALSPGDAVAATFGIGFAMNDQTSLTLSYQQEHVFGAFADRKPIKGSDYDFGSFNFGVGYEISKRVSINLGVGIGAGPNTPVAKILFDIPIRFSAF